MSTLTGRVAAITGGARGIGASTAAALAREGVLVAIGDIGLDLARRTAERLGGSVRAYHLDVTDRESFEAFLDAVESELGELDVLVNNAGIMPAGAFMDETAEATERQIDINVYGVLNGCRLALPRFVARGRGQLVNVSSAAGRSGFPGIATYCGTKFFVYGFSDALRPELAGTGVNVSVVMPGFVDTELTAGLGDARFYKRIAPEDVAAGILDAIRKPRFEVFVPKAMGPISKISGLLPAGARDGMTRMAVAERLALEPDEAARSAYEQRAAHSAPKVLTPGSE